MVRGVIGLVACMAAPGHAFDVGLPATVTSIPAASAGEDRARAVGCMAAAIAYEAGTESVEGRQAVAEVILNRLRAKAFPKTVCGVVFAGADRVTGCQFTFTCDGSLRRHLSDQTIAAARLIAEQVLDGSVPDRVLGATHYHAAYVSPYWAPSLVRVARLGLHIFYRLPGVGEAAASNGAVVPHGEPLIASLGAMSGRAIAAGNTATAALSPPTSSVFAPWGLSISR